jgi:acyl dehydratase
LTSQPEPDADKPPRSVPDVQDRALNDSSHDEASKLIGVWLRRDVHWPATYEPISQHDIRRWAIYSVGDDNPLWSDSEYAKRTRWGGTIAPPTFLYTIDTTIVAPGLAGVQWIFGGTEWMHYRPIRVGDTIVARARLTSVEEKTGRSVPRLLIQRGEVEYRNQRDEMVAHARSSVLRVPRSRSGQGIRQTTASTPPSYTAEQIETFAAAYRSEERRGREARYWDDVQAGHELAPVLKGPLTLVDIVGFYAGRRNVYNVLKLAFAERVRHPGNVYVSPATGIPVHPAAGHFDPEIAREVGMPRTYDQGFMRIGWLGHLVTNWAGDDAFVRRLNVRLEGAHFVGDVAWCRGSVTALRTLNGAALADLALEATNQDGRVVARGEATVELLSRRLDP